MLAMIKKLKSKWRGPKKEARHIWENKAKPLHPSILTENTQGKATRKTPNRQHCLLSPYCA